MINQAREVFCQRRFPASLIYVLMVSPPPSVPSTLMPLPSRSTSAGLPVVLDIALLPCSPLPMAAKETESDCLWVRDLQMEVKPPCVPPSSLQTHHSDGSSGEPGSRWLLERSRTFLTF